MATRLIASLSSAAVVLVNAVVPTDYGNFIYQSNGSYPVKMTFNTTKEGHAQFSIECERRYEVSFQLSPNPRYVAYGSINEFTRVDHQLLLDKVLDVCPQLSIKPRDLQSFDVGLMGNLHTFLDGKLISLERQWLPLRPGRYVTVDPGIVQEYTIYQNGYTYVRLSCENGGKTENKLFRLLEKENGQRYELTDAGYGTVEDLKESLMRVCPFYKGTVLDVKFEEQVKRFRFAEGYFLFAMMDYLFNRAHGEPLSR
ncbi:hypothetical protein FOZ63_016572 [Perkinsus olseni]|uniref:Uncharacterized protein n=1 Tax=Perkinsus olseni TaxID=32597 RepID=A0A7J6TU84_PEROL|nr:hypothetical protein FOZ60_015226 [Perkinsus olseni]KAF4716259.1 hypothetical protein FOZ62_019195 [Perkinsus olseni]KAF4748030.1 hypothetical protein FOZ63_016572 [Perkinsus olseni]